jgi:hypothetical protein
MFAFFMNMKRRFWPLLIIAIGLFLRTYHLKELPPGLYTDEAMNGNNNNALPARPRTANATWRRASISDLAYPLGNGFSGKAAGSPNPRNTSVPQGENFASSHESPTPFVKE